MRKWACFTAPVAYDGRTLRKIMLFRTPNGETRVFLYTETDAQICAADESYPTLEDALSVWEGTPHAAWVTIDDPLPGCQEDAFVPLRVKGRDVGKPEWGRKEILRDGKWVDYNIK